MTQWEYSIEVGGNSDSYQHTTQRLIQFGSEGWELCGVHDGDQPGCIFYYFKRPKAEATAPVPTDTELLDALERNFHGCHVGPERVLAEIVVPHDCDSARDAAHAILNTRGGATHV